MIRRSFIWVMAMLVWAPGLWAQGVGRYKSDTLAIHFPSGSAAIEASYADNAAVMDNIAKSVEVTVDTSRFVRSFRLLTSTSPDGPPGVNAALAQQRTEAVCSWLCDSLGVLPGEVSRAYTAVSWEELASELSASGKSYADRVGRIVARGGHVRNNIWDYSPAVWMDIVQTVLPDFRRTVVIITSVELPQEEEMPQQVEYEVTVEQNEPAVVPDPVTPVAMEAYEKPKMPWTRDLTVKTNLAMYPVLVMNLALEIDITDHLSFHLPVFYSPFDWGVSTIKFRCMGLQPELRWWFAREGGLFVGAHYGAAIYNFAVDGQYRIQDHDGITPMRGGGATVGYRLPGFGKNKRWSFEFTLGVGVYAMDFDRFDNIPNGRMTYSHVLHTYVGPDVLSVNLLYRIPLKKYEQ